MNEIECNITRLGMMLSRSAGLLTMLTVSSTTSGTSSKGHW